jgi:hypothetical protein
MAVAAQLENEEGQLQAYFRQEDLTDGLPIIVPTRERVDAFLAESGFAPHRDADVGEIAPLNASVTIEDVAINVLMAGARPCDLGIVLGAIEAMRKPQFFLEKLQATTNPDAPFVWVNGPIVRELGLGTGHHALGPGRHPNGAIGRSIRLVLRNLGGATDDVDHSTLGQPAKYSFFIGEAEDDSPWEPYHVSRGFRADQNVVSVSGIENIINVVTVTGRHTTIAEPFLYQFGRLMNAIGTNLYQSNGSPVIIVTPGQARRLAEEGYDRKRLQEELFEVGKTPVEDFPFGNYPLCKWKEEDGKVLPFPDADDIRVIVAGGGEPLHAVFLQPFLAHTACEAEVWTPGRFQ